MIALALLAACTSIAGDRITGRDLARADAAFASMQADFVAGFSPLPGVQRWLEPGQLTRIARAHGIQSERFRPLCFKRESTNLKESRVRDAMLAALPRGTTLEILDFTRDALPDGELQFAASGLGRPHEADPAAPVIWRGRLAYGSGRSVSIQATVRVLSVERWVEAARSIGMGRTIEAADLRVREESRFPFATVPIRDTSAAIGRIARRTLAQGQALTPALLKAAPDIRSGEAVDVEIASGGVRLKLTGRALSSGAINDVILVAVDPGKRLKGRVQEEGKVLIDAERR